MKYLDPSYVTVNLPVGEVDLQAMEGETVDALIERALKAHPDLTSVMLIALPRSSAKAA